MLALLPLAQHASLVPPYPHLARTLLDWLAGCGLHPTYHIRLKRPRRILGSHAKLSVLAPPQTSRILHAVNSRPMLQNGLTETLAS